MRIFCLLIALIVFIGEMKVKKQSIHITDYIEANGLKAMKHKEELLFDKRGNKIEEIEYSHASGSAIRSVKSIYNDQNQLVHRKEIDFRNSFFTETTFKYHPLNDKDAAEMKEVNSRGKLVFLVRREFDKKGRIAKEIWLDSTDTTKIESYSNYAYDDKNQSMEMFSYFQGEPSARFSYKYDDLGRPIEISEFENSFTRIAMIDYADSVKTRNEWLIKNGVKKRTITEVFDLKGNALKWVLYNDSDEKVFKVHEFKYQYDRDGQIQKREEFVGGKLKQDKVYRYEYY